VRLIAYARVSTAEQAERGHSLEAQRAKLEAYAGLYGHELARVEVDAGESAGTLERPALRRALRDLRGHDGLLVVKLDRLTRSVRDLAELVDGPFKKRALLSVEEKIDTSTASGRMILNVLTSVGQWEREAIGERTRTVKRHQRALGQYVGGDPPYGWRVGAAGLEPVPERQLEVARALEWRARGVSVRGVAELMGWSAGRAQRVLGYAAKGYAAKKDPGSPIAK
jgi:site-specific DNA recombinase